MQSNFFYGNVLSGVTIKMKKLFMKQIILEYQNLTYNIIGYSQDSSLLNYMVEFLENISLEQALQGAQAFHLSQINDFMIEYNKKKSDKYYVAFWNLIDSTPYQTEVHGITILDDEKIPKLKLSFQNFEYIFTQWAYIKQTNPRFMIIEQDNTGFIHLYDKKELTIEELALVEQYKKIVARLHNQRQKKINSLN